MIDGTWGMPDGWGSVVLFGDVAVPPSTPPIIIPGPPPVVSTECVCGITDAFGRTVSAGWGTSDAGLAWNVFYDVPIDTGASVDGAVATLFASDEFSRNGGARDADLVYTPVGSTSVLIKMRIRPSTYPVLEGFTTAYVGFGATGADIAIRIWDDSTAEERGPAGNTTRHAIVGVDVTEWFWARIELSTTVYRWRAWNDGNAEPATWTDGVTWSGYSDGFMEFDLSPTRFSGVDPDGFGDITLLVDSVDITGLDKCSEFRFDNFDRIVASPSWGTASGALAWTTNPPSPFIAPVAWTASVDGSAGVLHVDATTVGHGSAVSVQTPAIGVSALSWTASARFKFANLTTDDITVGPYGHQVGVVLGSHFLFIKTGTTFDTGYLSSCGSDAAFHFVANQFYIVEFIQTDGVGAEMRLWPDDGTPRPSLPTGTAGPSTKDLLSTIAASVSLTSLGSPSSSQDVTVDYINFDYAGKPCYLGACDCSPVESFGRTVATGWGLSEIDNVGFNTNPSTSFSVTPGSGNVLGPSTAVLIPVPGAASVPFEVLEEFTIPGGADGYVMTVGIESSGYAEIDFTRTGSTIETEFYAHNPGGSSGDNVHSGQLSGFAGVPIKVRLRVDATISAKWWLASDPEPGSWSDQIVSGGSPDVPQRWVNYNNDALTVQRIEFTAGYVCGGTITADSPRTIYIVSNNESHVGDPDWFSLTSGTRLNVSYDGAFSSPPYQFHTYQTSVEGIPHWARDFAGHEGTGFVQREFITIGGSNTIRFKVDFDPNYGAPSDIVPMGVGLFAPSSTLVPGTSGTPHDGFSNLVDAIRPFEVITAGTWYVLNGRTVLISPCPLTTAWDENDFDTDQNVYWSNPQNGFADPSFYPWGASFGHSQSGDLFSRTGFDPYVITIEITDSTTTFVPCRVPVFP